MLLHFGMQDQRQLPGLQNDRLALGIPWRIAGRIKDGGQLLGGAIDLARLQMRDASPVQHARLLLRPLVQHKIQQVQRLLELRGGRPGFHQK